MKKILSLILFALLPLVANAESLDEEQARYAAAEFFNPSSQSTRLRAKGQQLKLRSKGHEGGFYIFDRPEGGSVFVADDDAIGRIVLGYTDQGNYDTENIPVGLQDWLDQITVLMNAVHEGKIKKDNVQRQAGEKVVDALIQTKWAQGTPFNNLCPMLNGKRCITGCVATAMAQVMKYWKWPKHGYLSISYFDPGCGQTLSQDISSHNYDWDNMLSSYSNSYTSEQTTAVATLMRDCGYTVHMKYTPDASGASVFASHMHDYFHYSVEAVDRNAKNFSEGKWHEFIRLDLKAGRPVLYAGFKDEGGGHQFILDGYDTGGYYHVNWGWGGYQDGWFMLTNLNGYNNYQRMINNLKPDYDESFSYALNLDGVLTISGTGEMPNFDDVPWVGERTRISKIVIDEGITSIDSHAFKNCENLTSVTIPYSVKSIGSYVFYNCKNLSSVISKIQEPFAFGNRAFDGISSACKLTVPGGTRNAYINKGWTTNVFKGGVVEEGSTTSIIFADAGVKALCVANWDTNKDGELSKAEAAAVTDLGEVFKYNADITSFNELQYFTKLTSIGSSVFMNCSGLTSVNIPSSVTSIDHDAFINCSGLTSVTIPNSVTSINYNAFGGCASLISIFIPKSVTSIGDAAFYNCNGLTSIKVETGNTIYDSRDNCNAIIKTATNTLIACCKNTVIPESVTNIGLGAFANCSGLTSITIPGSVTTIGDMAFVECSGLTSVTIPNSVTSVGMGAFNKCKMLNSVISMIQEPFEFSYMAFDNIASTCKLTVPKGKKNAYINKGWTTNVFKGGIVEIEEDSSPAINFADANVKALCVANWDTNKDGKLSKMEAAAVTDLGEIFRSNKNITSFDELQYFTGLESIGDRAFATCSNLTSITIPNTVTNIDERAFLSCSNITSIIIPNSVTNIGYEAFAADGLTSITIPRSVTSIGDHAFSACINLTSIKVETGNASYDSRNNCNAIIEKASNSLIAGCENTILPESISSIGEYAFLGCTGLTSVIIPEGVTSIDDKAFYGCSGLTSVTIPNSVTNIDSYAFSMCNSLTSITIPGSVTNIGDYAFWCCNNLSSVISKIQEPFEFGYNAFANISSICKLTVPSGKRNAYFDYGWTTNVFQGGVVEEENGSIGSLSCGDIILTSGGETAYLEIMLNTDDIAAISGIQFNFSLPQGVQIAQVYNENDDEWVNDVTFPIAKSKHFVGIMNAAEGYMVYLSNSGDKSLTFKATTNPVAKIGIKADNNVADGTYDIKFFKAAMSDKSDPVQSFEVPDFTATLTITGGDDSPIISFADANVKKLCVANWDTNNDGELSEEEAAKVVDLGTVFKNNQSITSFKELQFFTGITSIGDDAFSSCSGLTSVSIPNGVISIGNCAFWGCSSLISVTIPESVTNIDIYAFNYCSSLTSIAIPNSVTNIGNYAFWGCNSLSSINIPNRMTRIGEGLFYQCNALNTITIPNSITNIGNYAFCECGGLTSVTIPGSVTDIGNYAFEECSALGSITIPKSVTDIGERAFAGCSNLTSIKVETGNTAYDSRNDCNAIIETGTNTLIAGCKNTIIPESVTNIEVAAFINCSGLTSITIPSSVTSIGEMAFQNCSNLTSVTIPENVTNIGYGAFAGCSSLTDVYCYAKNVPETDDYAFEDSPIASATLHVPAGSVEAYRTTAPWSGFGTIVTDGEVITMTSEDATFSCDQDLDFSGRYLRAYVAAGFNKAKNQVLLVRIYDVPAGTGVFLVGTPGDTYRIPYAETSSSYYLNLFQANLQESTVAATKDDKSNYIFGKQDGKPGFYPINGQTTLQAQTAYLQLPSSFVSADVKKIEFVFEEEVIDGIEEFRINDSDETIYDLTGRRLSKTQRGVNIVNGRKVVIK